MLPQVCVHGRQLEVFIGHLGLELKDRFHQFQPPHHLLDIAYHRIDVRYIFRSVYSITINGPVKQT